MEARLTALSIAFDAYVELGDIREQLAGYPDTSQLRREVREALTALAEGRSATPIESRDLAYWLPHATNAVLAIAAGSTDPAAEESARSLSPDAELFIVAAAGAAGHGPAVRGRLPPLLITDGTLSPAQQALWRAALAGTFGGVGDVLAGIEPWWQPAIAAEDPTAWLAWVRRQAGPGYLAPTEWIRDRTAATTVAPPPGSDAPTSGPHHGSSTSLRTVVSDLAGSGFGEEVALLRRARELRARIEDPGAPSPARAQPAPDSDDAESSDRVPVVDAVRAVLTDKEIGAPARTLVLGWLAPSLSSVLDTIEGQASRPPDFTESVPSPGGAVQVTPGGADNAVVEQRCAEILSANRPSALGLYLFAGVVVATLIAGLALVVAGSPGSAVLFFFLAGVGCLGTLYHVKQRLSAAKNAEVDVKRFRERIAEAQATAQASETHWRTEQETIRRLAGEARTGLNLSPDRKNTLPAHTRQGAGNI